VESRFRRRLCDRSDTEDVEWVMGGCKTETGEGDGPRDMVLMSSWWFVRDVVNYRYMRYGESG
jgi:hypothetical protein